MVDAMKQFVDAIKTRQTRNNDVYSAVVSHIDDEGIVWVNVAGSSKETPTASATTDVKRGDVVNVQWRNNKLYIAGNSTNPAAGVQRVEVAEGIANIANRAAMQAVADASIARDAAESASDAAQRALTDAERAKTAADAAQISADEAGRSAAAALTASNEAKAAAYNANEYASRALGNLSTVQSVAETLAWVTQHGTMTLTTDTQLDPTHVYFVRDPNGDYVVGSNHYSIVVEPDASDLSTYYELSIDESLNNYVATHLALTEEGLWLLPAATGTNRVLIATGAGQTYPVAGTYIINSTGGIVASFRSDGATIGEVLSGLTRSELTSGGMSIKRNVNGTDVELANIGYGSGNAVGGGTAVAPYYTLGERKSGSAIGNYSIAEGSTNESSGFGAHAEGWETTASGDGSHAEGYQAEASGEYAHAEGSGTTASDFAAHAEGTGAEASGVASHAEGVGTTASGADSHAEGSGTTASGSDSHAEGALSNATGLHSHAEGRQSQALGASSHAEGTGTQAIGNDSHAQGSHTQAVGHHSFAAGDFTIASDDDQTVIGKFNKLAAQLAFIIGNGQSENNRSNALWVDWDGNLFISGKFDNSVLIYDKDEKLHVTGTINSSTDSLYGLLNQGQGEGTSRDVSSWNIEGMDLSPFKRLRVVFKRANGSYRGTGEFFIPLDGSAVNGTFVSGATIPAYGDRNRLLVIGCAVDSAKSKFCVTQTFSLYGTAATTVSDMYVERIEGLYM